MRSLTLINGWGGCKILRADQGGCDIFVSWSKRVCKILFALFRKTTHPPTEILNDQSLTKWIIVKLWFEHNSFLFFYDYDYDTIYSLSLYPLLHHWPTIAYCMYTNRATIMKNNHRCSLTTCGHVWHVSRPSPWQNFTKSFSIGMAKSVIVAHIFIAQIRSTDFRVI